MLYCGPIDSGLIGVAVPKARPLIFFLIIIYFIRNSQTDLTRHSVSPKILHSKYDLGEKT